jgi:hypothetical protein
MPKSRNRRAKRRKLKGNRNPGTVTSAVPRNLRGNFPFPESRIVKLNAKFVFSMQGASPFSVHDFRLNSLYQFDVVGGTTNDFSGTTQLAAIYDSYHVQSCRVSFTLSGNETGLPMLFGITFKDDQPSTSITTLAHAQNSLEVAPTTGTFMVGQTTGMEIYRSKTYRITCGSIVGNKLSYNSDLSYTAAFGTNPAQACWMSPVAYGVAGNITNGLICLLNVELTVKVYSIKVLQE